MNSCNNYTPLLLLLMYRRGGLFFGVLKSCEDSTAESLAKTFSRRPLGDESGLEDVEFIILEISMLL